MNIRKKQKKITILGALIAISVLGIALAISYWGNGGEVSSNNMVEASKRVDIDYSPATKEQKDGGESAKKDLADKDTVESDGGLAVELSAFKKSDGGVRVTANIRALVASEGVCELTITKGNDVKEQQSGIAAVTDYSTCEGFNIANLSKGIWQVQVKVTSGGQVGSSSTTVEV